MRRLGFAFRFGGRNFDLEAGIRRADGLFAWGGGVEVKVEIDCRRLGCDGRRGGGIFTRRKQGILRIERVSHRRDLEPAFSLVPRHVMKIGRLPGERSFVLARGIDFKQRHVQVVPPGILGQSLFQCCFSLNIATVGQIDLGLLHWVQFCRVRDGGRRRRRYTHRRGGPATKRGGDLYRLVSLWRLLAAAAHQPEREAAQDNRTASYQRQILHYDIHQLRDRKSVV